jgi:hypothetical protein
MRTAKLAGIAVLAIGLCAGPAGAKNLPANGMTIGDIAAWLQGEGYKAQIQTANDGTKNIYSSSNGQNFHIYQYDCKNGRCGSLQFSVGFDTKGAFNPEKMNEWNRDNRWARAYIDKVNDPWLEYDVDLEPGGTYELLNDEFHVWQDSLDHFHKFTNQ